MDAYLSILCYWSLLSLYGAVWIYLGVNCVLPYKFHCHFHGVELTSSLLEFVDVAAPLLQLTHWIAYW